MLTAAHLRLAESSSATLQELASGTRVAESDLSGLRRAAVAVAFALFALNIVDILVTGLLAVGLGALEINSIMAPLIGTPWAAGLKFAIPMVVVVLASRVVYRRAVLALWCATGLYVLIAASGVGQLLYVLLVLLP